MSYLLTRKPIKSITIRVKEPDGQIHVSAPWYATKKAIQKVIDANREWIADQQARLQARPKLRDGETHQLFGLPYTLQIIEQHGLNEVVRRENSLLIYTDPTTPPKKRKELLDRWYRRHLERLIPTLLAKWEPIIEVQSNSWGIRKMRTRWGTCNITDKKIWLSLTLAKHPIEQIEHVIVHELVHLHERYHNKRFYSLMDRFLPQWRTLDKAMAAFSNLC